MEDSEWLSAVAEGAGIEHPELLFFFVQHGETEPSVPRRASGRRCWESGQLCHVALLVERLVVLRMDNLD